MALWADASRWLLLPVAQLFNFVLTFWGALAFALLAARFAPSPAFRKHLLLLPFVKLGYDLWAGVPADNYALGAYAGTRWALGRYQLGFGWEAPTLVPSLQLRLGALGGETWHSLSAGDLLAHAVFYRGAWALLALLLLVTVAFSLVRVTRRLRAWRRFGRALARDAARGQHGLRLGRATVHRCARGIGPFTSGVLRPTIWLPARTAGFGPAERRAILRHELAHIRHGDVALFALVDLLSDLLWFVPGVGLLAARVHEAAERAADAAAVRRGADPLALASALTTAAQLRLAGGAAASASGGTATARRVRTLLAPPAAPARARALLLAVISASVAVAALQSSFFGFR